MRLFWRASPVPSGLLLVVAALAVGGYVLVETYRVEVVLPDHDLKLQAARETLRAFEILRAERLERGLAIDPETDPAGAGLVGGAASPITSKTGDLQAKHTATNPNWAAVFVALYREAGLEPGDTVAFGLTGSFPALNAAALVAARVFGLHPVIVTSVSSSMWGANQPDFTWLDMEVALRRAGLVGATSVAASLGGIEDRGIGLGAEGRRLVRAAMTRCGVPELRGATLPELVEARLAAYEAAAAGARIAAFVNIGGGIASVGSLRAKRDFRAGINLAEPASEAETPTPGVLEHFARQGLPVLHVVRLRTLAARFGLPWDPAAIPPPGEGGVFRTWRYATWLVWLVIAVLVAALLAVTRLDLAFALARPGSPPARGPSAARRVEMPGSKPHHPEA